VPSFICCKVRDSKIYQEAQLLQRLCEQQRKQLSRFLTKLQ